MECSKCHKEIKEPLELYTGDMICPKCKGSLIVYSRKFTASNPKSCENFALCELYYHYALCKVAGIPATDLVDKSALTPEKMIEKAIHYCREAVKLGHPEALWRLAFFYDKGYLERNTNEALRIRIAANMYLSVVTAPEIQFEGYGVVAGEDETLSLKRRCADDLLCLMRAMSERDRSSYVKKLIEAGFLTQESAREMDRDLGKSDTEVFKSLLSRMTSKRRAPLFGVVRIKKEQLERLTDEISNNSAVNQRKLDLMFIPLNKDDTYDFRNSIDGMSPYHIVRTSKSAIAEGIKRAVEKAETNCCVYFFNRAGKHRFYNSSAKKAKIQSQLGTDMIDRLVSNTVGYSLSFYDDDVYMKNERADKLIMGLNVGSEV